MGLPGCKFQKVNITNDDRYTWKLDDCGLVARVEYTVIVFVRRRAEAYGTLGSIPFYLDESNSFTVVPAIVAGPSANGVILSGGVLNPGVMWVYLTAAHSNLGETHESSLPYVNVRDTREYIGGIGENDCRQKVEVEAGMFEVELRNCKLTKNTLYRAVFYVEDFRYLADGSFAALDVYVPISNDFDLQPRLIGTPDNSGATFQFSTEKLGRIWGMLLPAYNERVLDIADIKSLQGVGGWPNPPQPNQI